MVDIREEPDLPPKRPFTPPRKPAAKPTPIRAEQPTLPEMRQSIEDFYVLGGTLLSQVPNPRTQMVGAAVVTNANKCAESIIEAAKKDPRLKRALIRLTTAGAYSGIFIAHTPIIMAAYVAFQAPATMFTPPETVDENAGERAWSQSDPTANIA